MLHAPKTTLRFLLLGVLLAGLYWAVQGPPDEDGEPQQIVISRADVAHQQARWQRMWGRAPTTEELRGALDGYVRNEILYREALARGMDREDPRVRVALIQKMQMLTAAQADARGVSEDDLAAFFALRKTQYRLPARISVSQVFFKDQTNGQARAKQLLSDFREAEPSETTLSGAGDTTILETTVRAVTAEELERQFGSDFAAEVLSLPADQWSGPVRSGYGLHVVKVFDRVAGRDPELSEVRDKVENDLRYEAGKAAEEQGFQEIAGKFKVVITEDAEQMLEGTEP